MYVEVVEDDSVTVTVGNRVLIVNEDGNVRFCRSRIRKFNGHWGGFGMSFNSLLNLNPNLVPLGMAKDIAAEYNGRLYDSGN